MPRAGHGYNLDEPSEHDSMMQEELRPDNKNLIPWDKYWVMQPPTPDLQVRQMKVKLG